MQHLVRNIQKATFQPFSKFTQNITKNLYYTPQYNFTQQNWPRPWKQFQNVSQQDLGDVHLMKNTLRKNMPRVPLKAKYGLFHGRVHKTGKQTCFSERKSIRWWKVNVQKRTFKSDVLDRKIQMSVSTAALKNMRKLGGFDNYILLSKSKNMYSPYGEYLRKLMITKMNNPEWEVPYIIKSQPVKKEFTRRQMRFKGKEAIWHPPEQRYIDLSHLRLKQMHELNRQELQNLRELEELENKQEDISANHPLIKEIQDQIQKEMEILEPDRQQALQKLQNVKEKKYLREILKTLSEGQKEFLNPPNIKNK